MKKYLTMLLGLFIIACTNDLKEVVTTGRISGIVSDKTTGEPVATVSATLSPSGRSTVTGSDGAFEFLDITPGEYNIKISKEGYNDNNKPVTVVAGQISQAHLLIHRIPAVITADRNVLDFGDSYSLNTLSFNIVNNNFEKLSWEIVNNCGWITDVTPKSGVLDYSKTGTIIVKIDRELLADGDNTTMLVLSTEGVGSTEIMIKAYGKAKKTAILNTLESTDITAYTAVLNGEVIDFGNPSYTERGFVISENSMPTIEQNLQQITATVTSDSVYSCKVAGLSLNKTYYVRAYAVNSVGTSYSSNQVTFTTMPIAGKVSMKSVDNINLTKHTAIAHGEVLEVGEPVYSERGFVYSNTNSSPTVYDNCLILSGIGKGLFDAKLETLESETTYYVRSYIKNEAGVSYSEEIVSFNTNSIAGKVAITEVANIDVSEHTALVYGEVLETGDPAYSECGIVYSHNNKAPTIYDNVVISEGTGLRTFVCELEELERESVYYVRSYIKNDAGVSYSDNTLSFSTEEIFPSVETLGATDIDMGNGSAVLHANIINVGDPTYTERGFVYSSQYSMPTINDNKIVVDGLGTGEYEARVNDLPKGKTTYVRAYVTNNKGTIYGNAIEVVIKTEGYVILEELGIMVQTQDVGEGSYSSMFSLCKNSVVGGYTDWRLPTQDELAGLYNLRKEIGGFYGGNITPEYWSSTYSHSDYYYTYYYVVSFYTGSVYTFRGTAHARAVRTITK